jgi:hypothetical protein
MTTLAAVAVIHWPPVTFRQLLRRSGPGSGRHKKTVPVRSLKPQGEEALQEVKARRNQIRIGNRLKLISFFVLEHIFYGSGPVIFFHKEFFFFDPAGEIWSEPVSPRE